MEILVAVVVALLVIAAASIFGARLGVAAPLVLVVIGLGASLLPFMPKVEIAPEVILTGVLPPLLYAAAVSMPAMNFRREFTAIGGLSIVLVVASALVLGAFFAWVIPGLGLGWGVALGAIISPTDAVATSIVKRIGGSPRIGAILEGEGLFNDASALVVLRAAIAGVAASISLWGVFGEFVYSVAVAVVIGYVIGRVNLLARARVKDAAVNTLISFTVPFLASIPAEALGASGLVAAAVAGLVTGHGAARRLSPQHRLSDTENWRTVEMILEGTVFLIMGLQLSTIIGDVEADHAGIGTALAIAAGALLLTIVVRAVYVGPLLGALAARATRGAQMKPGIEAFQARLDDPNEKEHAFDTPPGSGPGPRARGRRPLTTEQIENFRVRLRRTAADIDYFLAERLGWREGVIIVWAGMRGVVTLAAAQTLPENAPSRSLLILVAFVVATGSLLLQGLTLPRLAAWLMPAGSGSGRSDEERIHLMALLDGAAATVTAGQPALAATTDGRYDDASKRSALAVINAQRRALLDARDDGTYSADALNTALAIVDADQISLEMKGAPVEEL